VAKPVGPQGWRSVCVSRYHPTLTSPIVDLDQARQYIFFLRVLGATNMKEALEINGSLALAGNEVLEPGLELGQLPADAPQTNP
jgi:hypothetical protein